MVCFYETQTNISITDILLRNIDEKINLIVNHADTLFCYKQSIFDPGFENCLSFSKKSPQNIV